MTSSLFSISLSSALKGLGHRHPDKAIWLRSICRKEFWERAEAETFCPPNPSSWKAGPVRCLLASRRAGTLQAPLVSHFFTGLLLQVPTPRRCGFFTSGLLLSARRWKALLQSCCLGSLALSPCEAVLYACRHYRKAFASPVNFSICQLSWDCWSFLDVGRKLESG